MSRRTAIMIVTSLVVVSACLALAFLPAFKRSIPGRIIRFVIGKPGAVQVAEDLAEDALHKPALAGLQQWSTQVLTRYASGQLTTNGPASYWSVGDVKLAPTEIPSAINNAWPETPEISVRLSQTGQPECVAISWYLSGLVVGPPNYVLSFQPWCSEKAKPGVYAYHLDK